MTGIDFYRPYDKAKAGEKCFLSYTCFYYVNNKKRVFIADLAHGKIFSLDVSLEDGLAYVADFLSLSDYFSYADQEEEDRQRYQVQIFGTKLEKL